MPSAFWTKSNETLIILHKKMQEKGNMIGKSWKGSISGRHFKGHSENKKIRK